jgi:hypothetical protein
VRKLAINRVYRSIGHFDLPQPAITSIAYGKYWREAYATYAMMRTAADQPNRCTGNLHQLLPEVLARKQAEQRFRRIFQAMYNVLLVYEAAVPMAPVQCLEASGEGICRSR